MEEDEKLEKADMEEDEKLEKADDEIIEKKKGIKWEAIIFKRIKDVLKQRAFWYAFIVAVVIALSPSLVDVLFAFIAVYGILRLEAMRNEARNTR